MHLDLGPDEMRAQAALRQLQALSVPGHGVVVGDRALLDDAQDLAPHLLVVGDEGRTLLFRLDGEAGVVLGDVTGLEPGVGRLDGRDPGQPHLLGQAVLQGGEQPLGASARLRRIGGDVLDPQMRQRPADLGQLRGRDFAAGLGGVKVMAAAVGVEGAEQAMLGNDLAQRREGRGGSFLFDQDHGVDPARGVVHGHDQVHRRQARDPHVPRPVLMQHQAADRPPRPLLAVRRALRRRFDQPGPVQSELRHGVAELVIVPLEQLLVEVLNREVGVLVPVEPEHPLEFLLRRPPRRRAAAPIGEPSLALRIVTLLPALEGANAHPQQLRRVLLRHLSRVPAVQNRRKPHLADSLANARHVHEGPSTGPPKTRHFTSYEITSLHKLATQLQTSLVLR